MIVPRDELEAQYLAALACVDMRHWRRHMLECDGQIVPEPCQYCDNGLACSHHHRTAKQNRAIMQGAQS